MGVITHIPNQPINFIDDTQSCKNNDNQAYAALVQSTDNVYIQWKQSPSTVYTNLSSFNLYAETGNINGSFTGNATGWTLGTGWAYNTNKIKKTAGVASLATFDMSDVYIKTGNSYIITFTVSSRTAGSVAVVLGSGAGSTTGASRSTNATFTETLAFSDSQTDAMISFSADASFDGYIDDVSVVGIPNTLSQYWTYSGTTFKYTHVTGNVSPLHSNTYSLALGYYAVVFTVSNSTIGTVTPYIGSDPGTASSGNGTFIRYFSSSSGAISFVPTSTFDGDISVVYVYLYNTTHTIRLIDADDLSNATIVYNISSGDYPLLYDDDRITWVFDPQGLEPLPGVTYPTGCWKVKLTDGTDSTTYVSETVMNVKATHDCTYIVYGRCTNAYAFGFNWNNFILYHRLRILRINPRYPSETDSYIYSTGTHRRNFSQSQKIWTLWVDKVDEPTHDAIRLQLLCDELNIDGTQYFCPADGYEPEWVENGKKNLARVKVDLQKIDDVVFNRNC